MAQLSEKTGRGNSLHLSLWDHDKLLRIEMRQFFVEIEVQLPEQLNCNLINSIYCYIFVR